MNFDPAKTVFLIDGSSFLYRAYYGTRPLHTSKGIPVQAVYSFCRMIKKLMDKFHPHSMAIVWDSKGKTTRHEMYSDYKATRQAPPSDLFDQKKLILEFADLLGIKQVAQQGIEADDILYSIAQEQYKEGKTVVLITADKDMGQAIVDDRIVLFDPWKEVILNEAQFEAKMGFPVGKLSFYFAILGDTSDNIPGVKGIGDKGALDLVKNFDSLRDLYANLEKVSKERVRTALQAHKENAFLSQTLFLLQYHPSGITTADMQFEESRWPNAKPLFEKLELKSLLKDIETAHAVEQGLNPAIAQKMAQYEFVTITMSDQLQHLCFLLKQAKTFAFDVETEGLLPLQDACVGISFCVREGTAYYVPFGHKTNEHQLSVQEVVAALKPIFADAQYKKILHNAKFDVEALSTLGISVNGVSFDTMIAASLVGKEWQRAGLKYLSQYYFEEPMLTFEEVVKNNKYKDFSYVPLELATTYAAADAHQTLRLKPLLQKSLENEKLTQLYEQIEFPLVSVLIAMEQAGINLDTAALQALDEKVTRELQAIECEICETVGAIVGTLNFNSPKQMEQLLFVQLQLPPQKKSAKGSYSTDQEVLELLAPLHPVPRLLIKYRELSKLKNTYIDALPTYINPHTLRIHTTFNQTSVATGRLASSDPNLQNIPTNTAYGLEIRAAFKPREGHVFLSADYSQIELRILAHLSGDAKLKDAFLHQRDIHAETAAGLFNVPLTQVTSEQRQIGKRINFSVLYGMTPYGLSQDMGIPFKDAKQYIEKYFEQYPGVSAWMEQVIIDTKHKGYVETFWGRRRYMPGIYEKNRGLYEEARRVAINTVAQGTAAEIMKQGMIKLAQALAEKKLGAQMLLQIHDELLISVPAAEIEQTEKIVKDILEHIVAWDVPLEVSTRIGANWKEVTK